MSQEEQVKAVRQTEAIAEWLLGGMNLNPKGLCIEMSQQQDFKNIQLYPDERFVQGIGTWAPVIVQSQVEKDYLDGLGLILGKDTKDWVLVDGIHETKLDTPPTYVRIPALAD